MAKIEAYKFINPGMATDNASEGSLVGRKLVLGYNRIGKTLTGILQNEVGKRPSNIKCYSDHFKRPAWVLITSELVILCVLNFTK